MATLDVLSVPGPPDWKVGACGPGAYVGYDAIGNAACLPLPPATPSGCPRCPTAVAGVGGGGSADVDGGGGGGALVAIAAAVVVGAVAVAGYAGEGRHAYARHGGGIASRGRHRRHA